MHRRNGFAAVFAALGAVLCGTVLAIALDGGAFSYRDFPVAPAPRLVDRGAGGAPGMLGGLPDLPVADRRGRRVRPEVAKRLVSLERLGARRPAGGRAPSSGVGPGAQRSIDASTPSSGRTHAGRPRSKDHGRRPSPPDGARKRPRPGTKAPRPAPGPPRRPEPPNPNAPGPPEPPNPSPPPAGLVIAPARDSRPAASDHPARLGPRTPATERPGAAPSGGGTTWPVGGEGPSGTGEGPPPKPAAREPLDGKAGPRYGQVVAAPAYEGTER